MPNVWTGTLKKMRVADTSPVSYFVRDGFWDAAERGPELPLNGQLGELLTLRHTGEIACVYCGRKTKKSFGQGFCFPCFQARAEADICIVKPELCHFHDPDNPCRDDAFAHSQCFQPHVLYASLTSGAKVGITRRPNIPSRWIDQGATAAVPLATLPSRREVGLVEKRLVEAGYQDKTHWTRMLKNESVDRDLEEFAAEVVTELVAWGVESILSADERAVRNFDYPVLEYPTKVKSHNLDKTDEVSGRLLGIKGQYLIFDTGVINLRKFTGYRVEIVTSA